MNQNIGNLYGFLAIIFWSAGALLVSFCTTIPTLLLIASVQFCCFATLSIKWIRKKENPLIHIKNHFFALMFTITGILSNALCFVYALRLVPEVEASLINYLWPMLTVFLSALLPDQKLKAHHIIGVLLGFIGVVCLIWKPEALSFSFGFGHALAFLGAVLWAVYSIGTRFLKSTPSDLVTITFFINACILYVAHLIFEPGWIVNWNEVIFITLLGTTSGIAYYAWDISMKNGHVQLIGTAANFTPVLSTLFLIGFGVAVYSHNIAIATLLILMGTLISSKKSVLALINNYKKKDINPI